MKQTAILKKIKPMSIRFLVFFSQINGFLVTLLAISVGVYIFVFNAEQTLWQGRQSDFAQTASRIAGDSLRQSTIFLNTINVIDADEHFEELVENITMQYPAIQEIIALDNDATILANYAPSVTILGNLFTIPQSNWFLRAKDGEFYMSSLQFSAQNTPYIIISRPLDSRNGAIAIRIDMSILNEVVRNIRFGETGNAYLTDDDGQILAHSDFSLVEQNTSIAGREELRQAQNVDGINFSEYVNFLGEGVIGTSLKIDGTDWIIFTEVAQSEAYATSRTALILLSVGLGVLFISVLFFTYNFLQRLIFNRLTTLQDAATQVTTGNLAVQVPVKRFDEIGLLATAFNTMTHSLQKSTDDLRQARDEAVDAKNIALENSRLKSEFLSTMSHELRTPLNAIEGFTGIMLGGMGIELDAKTHSMVERISTNSKRLTELVNDFLDLSRIESGRMDFVEVPFAPADLVDKWRRQLSVLAEQKGLQFITIIDPALPTRLLGDDDALNKIGQNLLSNAFKFTEMGHVTLELKYADEQWQIIVNDSGIGIPAHARDYIFEEFRQVDGTSTRRYGGTGLGLAIVQKMVRLMDGTVRVDSELGKGSTFTVTLPLKLIETPTPTEAVI